jgi:hypothetical protein
MVVDNLTATERTDLLAGLRLRDQRETMSDAALVGNLFETQLRILKQHEAAETVRSIVENLLGE